MNINVDSIKTSLEKEDGIGLLTHVASLSMVDGKCLVFKNGEKRKFILVQVRDPLSKNSEILNLLMETQYREVKQLILGTLSADADPGIKNVTPRIIRVIVAPQEELISLGLMAGDVIPQLDDVDMVIPIAG